MKKYTLFLFIFLINSICFASKIIETPSIDFSGGLNLRSDQSQIGDNESPDMSNLINDIYGSAIKRKGSKRYNYVSISSNPINSLYRAYIATQGVIVKALIATSNNKIYISTTESIESWISLGTVSVFNQHYSFETMNQNVILTSQETNDEMKKIDIFRSSMSSLLELNTTTGTIKVKGKYLLNSKNYLIAANCWDITSISTAQPTRAYYSYLLLPSSFSWNRYLDFRTSGKEEITGIGEFFGRVHFFFSNSIYELDFNILDPDPNVGDQSVTKIVNGFGLIAPRTLVNTGQFYIFLSPDGIRMWDGGRRTRLTVSEESRIISYPIEPIIRDIILNESFDKCSAIYYPRKEWYVFCYSDSKKYPKNKANSMLIFDLKSGQWFPFNNLNIESFVVFDKEKGQLLGGESNDGYVNYLDVDTEVNDYRREVWIDSMDSTASWTAGTIESIDFKEGIGAIKLQTTADILISSTSKISVFDFSKWNDLNKIEDTDLFFFRMKPSTIANIVSIRVDLSVDDSTSARSNFNANFTSVTISTGALFSVNTTWVTISFPISSFPVPNNWTSLTIEDFPFAKTKIYYGLRFVLTSLSTASVDIDDVRIVKLKGTPLNSYRLTKQINFGTLGNKSIKQVVLNTELSPDSKMYVDIYSDFGQFVDRKQIIGGFDKTIYVCGFSTEGITVLDSIDFSVIKATNVISNSVAAYRAITDDEKYLYAVDRFNHRLVKISKSSMTVIVSSVGSVGSGNNQFNNVWQIATDGEFLYLADMGNHRIKIHRTKDLSFVKAYGQLGIANTSYHLPTGIAVDGNFFYVGDDGSQRIIKYSKTSNVSFVSDIKVAINTFGNLTLAIDENNLYSAYNTTNKASIDHLSIFLEKRDKNSLEIVNSIEVKPKDNVSFSSSIIMGNISVRGDYIYIPFSDDFNGNGNYYLQKRYISDFSLIKEYKSTDVLYGVTACGLAFKPKRRNEIVTIGLNASYVQLKYSENELDNKMILNSNSFYLEKQEILEGGND